MEKFKRVVYLRRKGFNDFEAALTIGISKNAVSLYSELYNQHKTKALFKFRLEEIELTSSEHYNTQDKKKEYHS